LRSGSAGLFTAVGIGVTVVYPVMVTKMVGVGPVVTDEIATRGAAVAEAVAVGLCDGKQSASTPRLGWYPMKKALYQLPHCVVVERQLAGAVQTVVRGPRVIRAGSITTLD
jgi:hypothetical protein